MIEQVATVLFALLCVGGACGPVWVSWVELRRRRTANPEPPPSFEHRQALREVNDITRSYGIDPVTLELLGADQPKPLQPDPGFPDGIIRTNRVMSPDEGESLRRLWARTKACQRPVVLPDGMYVDTLPLR